jgi:hypothetical protein
MVISSNIRRRAEAVPELTRSVGIQLNERVSLQRRVVALLASQMHAELRSYSIGSQPSPKRNLVSLLCYPN